MTLEHHNSEEYISFYFDETLYAIPVTDTKEILLVPEITKVHHAENKLMGLINLRGDIFAIFDIKQLLGHSQSTTKPDSRILILKEKIGIRIGIIVDKINKISLQNKWYETINNESDSKRFIKGIVKKETKTINLLDLHRFNF